MRRHRRRVLPVDHTVTVDILRAAVTRTQVAGDCRDVRLVHDPVQLSIAVERSDMKALKYVAWKQRVSVAQLVRETLRTRAQEGGE